MRRSHSRNLELSLLLSAMAACLTAGAAPAQEQSKASPPGPAEESRLSTAVFHAGLKKRGLTELLELHLKDFPPLGPTESMLMLRDVRLAEYADPTLPVEQRREALSEANQMLTQVIEENPADARRFDWLFALAHSLLFDQAQPFFFTLLGGTGTAADRENLLTLSGPALALTKSLVRELEDEYKRVDRLPVEEFDKLEQDGRIEQLDRLVPRAEYLLLWALFYDSLPRSDTDLVRTQQLSEILERLSAKLMFLTVAHETSRIQVQTLLLAGMTNRSLNRPQPARELLSRAAAVAERLDDPEEQQRIQWATDLAWLERARNESDDHRFDEALALLRRFRERLAQRRTEDFGMQLAGALLERSVYRHRAEVAERQDRPEEARTCREQAWRALALLARQHDRRRDEIYATIYRTMGPQADPADLDPFEQCALVAGLLSDADSRKGDADALRERAVRVGERFTNAPPPGTGALVPEVLYNTGVAQYRLGRAAAAARLFIEVARDHPTFSAAPQAAAVAVQLSAELVNSPSVDRPADAQTIYRQALEVLLAGYADTSAAHYWRFHFAQLLEEHGDLTAAAEQYALVDPQHEHHLESLFFQARCLAAALHKLSAQDGVAPQTVRRRAEDFFSLQQTLLAEATSRLDKQPGAADAAALHKLAARARLLSAEVNVLPQIDRPAQALETLANFENDYPDESALGGRLWRVRLLASQRLGRLDEVASALPHYMAADAVSARQTLQLLYSELAADAERLSTRDDPAAARPSAEMALVLAERIYEWTAQPPEQPSNAERRAAALQLAEACLRTGQYQRALDLFATLLPDDAPATLESDSDVRTMFGRAEALFQLGKHGSALPDFAHLAVRLPPGYTLRWKALLRDLQCRTALRHPAEGIINVINQQKFLHPDLGGPLLAPKFEELRRENEQRVNSGTSRETDP